MKLNKSVKSNSTPTSELQSPFNISAVRLSFLLGRLYFLCLYMQYLPSEGNMLKRFKACWNIAVTPAKTNSLLCGFLPYQLSRLSCASLEGVVSSRSSSESVADSSGQDWRVWLRWGGMSSPRAYWGVQGSRLVSHLFNAAISWWHVT